ncbi:MAG TPA: class I SAM-dependent methyltransferase [Minicystis sp.]|nr:class I SAM-dependent methyltransferase [Minicystis sp.]
MSRTKRALNRALAFAHRQLERGARVVPEIALALLDDPDVVEDGIVRHYGPATQYVDAAHQRLGLYPFERRAVTEHFPPPPARLLVPGAGAGREMIALRALGYEAEGFDASPALVASAARALGPEAVRLETLQAWARDVTRRGVGEPYAGIVTGWTLWTHLVRSADRLAALEAFRVACPAGPVLLSFWPRGRAFDLEEGAVRPRPDARWLRVIRALRRAPPEPGTAWTDGMFAHLVGEEELTTEAAAAGYRVVWFERDVARFPNAVLLPTMDL